MISLKKMKNNYKDSEILLFLFLGDISSVGLEHRLDRAGVSGSNPLCPTIAGN